MATPSATTATAATTKNQIFERYTRSSLFLGRGGRGWRVDRDLDLQVLAGHVYVAAGQARPAVAVPEADCPPARGHVLDLEAPAVVESAEVPTRQRDHSSVQMGRAARQDV